jgi:hypothetical protein
MEIWRKCSSCKKTLPYEAPYWACNVSTCNRSRTFLAFCSVSCWDAHLGLVRHRESWAEERKAPTKEFWEKVLAGTELYPPRVPKEKEEVAPVKPAASTPKVVIRRKS